MSSMSPEAMVLERIGFDTAAYRSLYPDLQKLRLGEEIAHFCIYGAAEQRSAPIMGMVQPALLHIKDSISDSGRRDLFVRAVIKSRCQQSVCSDLDPIQAVDLLAAIPVLRPIMVIGDSHANLYGGTRVADNLLVLHRACWGGSARGLANSNSRSQYGTHTIHFLQGIKQRVSDAIPLLLHFGQVDVEFVYNFHRVRGSSRTFCLSDFNQFIDETLQQYGAFLAQVADIWGNIQVFVASILPPTLSDEAVKRAYANEHIASLHSEDEIIRLSAALTQLQIPDLRARTELHRVFNSGLRALCSRQNLQYVNLFDKFLNDEGVVERTFIEGHGGTDHHLHPCAATLKVFEDSLRTITRVEPWREGLRTYLPDDSRSLLQSWLSRASPFA